METILLLIAAFGVPLYFIFAKQPDPNARRWDGRPQPGASSDPIAEQTLTILDAIESRPTIAYHDEYHQHDYHAPRPQHCRFCQAANQPYAPTCSQCGAPLS